MALVNDLSLSPQEDCEAENVAWCAFPSTHIAHAVYLSVHEVHFL